MTDARLAELDEADALPHARPAPKLHRAAPRPVERPRVSDPGPAYWILTNLWRPQSVETIARTRALPKVVVETLLGELAQQGKVRQREDGLWERVPAE